MQVAAVQAAAVQAALALQERQVGVVRIQQEVLEREPGFIAEEMAQVLL